MRAVASIISIIVFLAFATTGAQKMIFNTMASRSAEHLGITKRTFRLAGLIELLGGVGVLIGLTARSGTFLAIVNEVCAGGLLVAMIIATIVHLRKKDRLNRVAPALVLGALCLSEMVLRLA